MNSPGRQPFLRDWTSWSGHLRRCNHQQFFLSSLCFVFVLTRLLSTTSKLTHTAFSTDGRDAVLLSGKIDIFSPGAGSELKSGSVVRAVRVGRDVLDGVEVVGPDGESTCFVGLVSKVVARVLHHKPDNGVAGEVEGQLDLRDVANVDRVRRVAAQGARGSLAPEPRGEAGETLVQRPLVGRGISHAAGPLLAWRHRTLLRRMPCKLTAGGGRSSCRR